MGDAVVVLAVLLALVALLFSLDYRDGDHFACLFAENRDMHGAGLHGYFQYSEESGTFVNRGERDVCVEDIIDFANRRRIGPDMIMNTVDDAMTLEQQVDMIGAMLEANFHGGFWVSTPWTFQYDGANALMSKLLYADPDEVVVISGSRTTYSGMIDASGGSESVFLIEGGLRVQRMAPLRSVLLAPLLQLRTNESRLEAVSAEGELWMNAFRIKKKSQLLYSTAKNVAGEGAFLLRIYSGPMFSTALWKFVWPSLKNGDLWSAWVFGSAFAESMYRNGILPVLSILFKKDEYWWNSQMKFSRREATLAAFHEEVFAEEVETGEEDAMPGLQRKLEELKHRRQAVAAQGNPTLQQKARGAFANYYIRTESSRTSDLQEEQQQQHSRGKHASDVEEERLKDTEKGDIEEAGSDKAEERNSRKQLSEERSRQAKRSAEWRLGKGNEGGVDTEEVCEEEEYHTSEALEDSGLGATKACSSACRRDTGKAEDMASERETKEKGDSDEGMHRRVSGEESEGHAGVTGSAGGEKREDVEAKKAGGRRGEATREGALSDAEMERLTSSSADILREALEILRARLARQKREWKSRSAAEVQEDADDAGDEAFDHEEL